jgi:hypothetical protein
MGICSRAHHRINCKCHPGGDEWRRTTYSRGEKFPKRFPSHLSNDDSIFLRAKEVFTLVKGYSYKMIASELKVSIDTINTSENIKASRQLCTRSGFPGDEE